MIWRSLFLNADRENGSEIGMKTLKAGDIRKKGDEVRRSDISESERMAVREGREKNKLKEKRFQRPDSEFHGFEWHKTELIGLPILPSDMMHLEFRRP